MKRKHTHKYLSRFNKNRRIDEKSTGTNFIKSITRRLVQPVSYRCHSECIDHPNRSGLASARPTVIPDLNRMKCCWHTPLHWQASHNTRVRKSIYIYEEKTYEINKHILIKTRRKPSDNNHQK